jgi:hypothetical protein
MADLGLPCWRGFRLAVWRRCLFRLWSYSPRLLLSLQGTLGSTIVVLPVDLYVSIILFLVFLFVSYHATYPDFYSLRDRSGWDFSPAVMKNKRIMQIDIDEDHPAQDGEIFSDQPFRFRPCPGIASSSGCRSYHTDRVYWTKGDVGFQKGRCLPLYDHFCGLLYGHVYLRTLKAYVHAVFFLTVDAFFSLVS